MRARTKFLVIDDDDDVRSLLVRMMRRTFPGARVVGCSGAQKAASLAKAENFDAVVGRDPGDADATDLIRILRRITPDVPLLMVAGADRCTELLAAGATAFLDYAEWLRAGNVVSELLQRHAVDARTIGSRA
jgi:DNA-binding NtrC family response regulator